MNSFKTYEVKALPNLDSLPQKVLEVYREEIVFLHQSSFATEKSYSMNVQRVRYREVQSQISKELTLLINKRSTFLEFRIIFRIVRKFKTIAVMIKIRRILNK